MIRPALRRGDAIPVKGARLGWAIVIGPHPTGVLAILPHLGVAFPLTGVVFEEEA